MTRPLRGKKRKKSHQKSKSHKKSTKTARKSDDTSSSSDSDSSPESQKGNRKHKSQSSDDSEFEQDPPPPSIQKFGLLVGQTLRKKLRTKILKDKFVEFADLLPKSQQYNTEHLVLKASTDGSGTACFGRPVTKKFTTIDEWNEAFAIYMVTYLNKPTTAAETQLLAQELCTYQRDVNNLHKDGLPWYDYDRRFRQDRETTQYSFASIRHDLMLNATMSRTNRYQNPKPNQPFRGAKPLDNQKKPSGQSTTPGG